MIESGADGEQDFWQNVPLPLLPPLVEQKLMQLTGGASVHHHYYHYHHQHYHHHHHHHHQSKHQSKRLNRLKQRHHAEGSSCGEDGDDTLLFNGCLVATEYQSHWLANHYPQMLRPSVWDDERRTYEKLLDIGTNLCRGKQFELALRCFSMAVPPNAADHAYLYALRAVVKLTSEMYEDAVVDAATVMLIFLTNTMWHRLFPHFRLAFTNAHLVVSVAFYRLGYVSAAKAWADRFVCMAASLPGHGGEILGALRLTELLDEVHVLHQTPSNELGDFDTIRQINVEDLKYHAQRVLLGGEKLSSTQLLFSIVHISLNYGYFTIENNLQFRDDILINAFRFHMALLQLPIIARIISVSSAFELSDVECQFFTIVSRFLLLPMCYCMNYNVCEELLTDSSFVGFLSTVAAELAADDAAIVRYKTDRPCFALISPVFGTILWAVWHRAPLGRARLLAGVHPFNDIEWHTDVLLADLGANGPPSVWLRLLDFFAIFYESFSVLPAFRAEIAEMPKEKLCIVVNKLAWLWSALFQYSIGGCLTTKEPYAESLEKASSDTSLVFWILIAKDDNFLQAMVRSQFWVHAVSHMEFMTKISTRNLLAPNVRTGRLKCIIDLLIAMLRTGRRSDWPLVFDERFFATIAKCLADLIFVGTEYSNELPMEITWLLLQLTTLLAFYFADEFPGHLASLGNKDYDQIAVRLFSILKQPLSEAIFKAAVSCTTMVLRNVPDKIHRALKKLKSKDVVALFEKLVGLVATLHELSWDEVLLAGACQFIDILLSNERCALAICDGGSLFESRQSSSHELTCGLLNHHHHKSRPTADHCRSHVVGDNSSDSGLIKVSADNEEDGKCCCSNYDILVDCLKSYSQELNSRQQELNSQPEIAAMQAVLNLLNQLDVVRLRHRGDGSVQAVEGAVVDHMSKLHLKPLEPLDRRYPLPLSAMIASSS